MEALRKEHREEMAVIRAEHREAQQQNRDIFIAEIRDVTDALKGHSETIRDSIRYRLGPGGSVQLIQPESKSKQG